MIPLATSAQRLRFGLGVILLCFVADQASKAVVLAQLPPAKPYEFLPFLDFLLVWNRGISYGLFASDSPATPYILFGIGVAICAWLFWLMLRQTTFVALLGFALIIGGAIGNLYDRLQFGAVVDFIHLHIGAYSWYVFNLADSWISIGVALVLYDSLVLVRKRS